ncbi:hypothetical protein BAE44_0006397 [Dichanthelium oligosanthes]|uniref:Uncharacterized protein n=1 Tax=Dichanthelium oligosanthes TaxID=888268 RepID=A0A1E5W5E2_9POAL|nr:hypothetical protein BAE44_0006397 [Dichanthelium oligosanthes]
MSSAGEAFDVVPEGPPVARPPPDSPPPPLARSMAERPEAVSFEWKLRAMVEMERRAWMSGDSEWARSVLRYLRTKHLQSLGIEPKEWMILKVMFRRGDWSWCPSRVAVGRLGASPPVGAPRSVLARGSNARSECPGRYALTWPDLTPRSGKSVGGAGPTDAHASVGHAALRLVAEGEGASAGRPPLIGRDDCGSQGRGASIEGAFVLPVGPERRNRREVVVAGKESGANRQRFARARIEEVLIAAHINSPWGARVSPSRSFALASTASAFLAPFAFAAIRRHSPSPLAPLAIMADPAAAHEIEVVEEDVVVAVEFAPCTTTEGRINNLVVWRFLPRQEELRWRLPPLRSGRVREYFWARMTDSNKGWRSKWFYVANPSPPLPRFSGRFAQKGDEWDWATGVDEKKAWVQTMVELVRQLKEAGLTGVRVLWTFFERRVQPLAARARPLFRYTGDDDSTRTSREPLTPEEVRSHVWAVIKRTKDTEDDITELDRLEAGDAPEPAAKRVGNDPPVPLHARLCYPPLPEDGDRRAANRAENERLRALSQEKKKRKAERARKLMLRAQRGSRSEESEEEEVTDDDDEGDDDENDDDDDDDDDVEGRYVEALGLGKRPAEGFVGEPSSKRGAARDVEPAEIAEAGPLAPSVGVEPPQPNPAVETLRIAVPRPTVTPTPVETLATPPPGRASAGPSVRADPFLQFLSRFSSPILHAAPIAAAGTSGSATAAAAGPAAGAEVATAGREEVPGAVATPRSTMESQAGEVPPGRVAVGDTKVLDLTGGASEEDDPAALLEAAMDEEEVEETDPERSEALPGEAAQEVGA